MNPDPDDKDLIEAFERLRENQSLSVAPFDRLTSARKIWHASSLAYSSVIASAAAVIFFAIFFLQPTGDPAGPKSGGIAFEQLSDLISQELFDAEAGAWKSPTDFLLDPQFP